MKVMMSKRQKSPAELFTAPCLAEVFADQIMSYVQPNSSLRTLKLSNNNTSLLSGMSSAKSLFKQKASQSGLNTTLS